LNVHPSQQIYHEFPRLFWVVVVVSFIDRIGGTLLFPFFALYITQKFNVGMTQAGILLGMSSLFGLIGSTIGGALTDKFGRKQLILFGLVFSAISTLTFGLVNDLNALYPLMVVVGLLSSVAHPAHDAMIADILPENQAGGLRRPARGRQPVVDHRSHHRRGRGEHQFFYLFVIDAVISCIVAAIIYRAIPETKPEPHAHEAGESLLQTVIGYRVVLKDLAFMAFMVAGMLMLIVYQQMYSTLSVYLRDNHNINPSGYGFLMTTSAITVVLFQFWVSRLIKHRPPFLMMAFGTVFYMIGFRAVRRGHRLRFVRAQHRHHYHRRDDRRPDQPGDCHELRPRSHARTLHGDLRTLLGDPLDNRTRRGRLYPGQLQPEPALVHRRSLVRTLRTRLLRPSSSPQSAT
jgi:MFS family permease